MRHTNCNMTFSVSTWAAGLTGSAMCACIDEESSRSCALALSWSAAPCVSMMLWPLAHSTNVQLQCSLAVR